MSVRWPARRMQNPAPAPVEFGSMCNGCWGQMRLQSLNDEVSPYIHCLPGKGIRGGGSALRERGGAAGQQRHIQSDYLT